MNDNYDNDYNEFASPKVEVKMGVKETPVQEAVQREVPPPSRKKEEKQTIPAAIAPPTPGELGPTPTVDIPKLQNTVNDTLQNTGGPVAPSFHSPIDIQGTLNNALQSPYLHSQYLIPGLIGAGLVGTALHAHLSSKKEDKIKSTAERDIKRIEPDMNVSQAPATGRVEPTFNTNEVPQNADLNQILKVVGGQVDSRRDAEMVGKSENNRAMKAGEPVPFPQLQTPQETAKEIASQSPITASTSPEESATIANLTEASKTPSEAVAEPSKAVAEPSKEVKGAVKPLLTGSGMPAIQGTAPPGTKLKKSFEGPHEIPSTHAFVPGGQYMDIVRNGVGQDAFTASLKNMGGYPETTEQAYELARKINESQSRLPRDVAKDLNIGLGEPTKAITQKVGGNKTVSMKTPLAALGAIIAMTDLAKADTSAERRKALRNVGEGFLPYGATPTEAGAPTLPPSVIEAQRQATLLGSPYHKFK
jgi:hypothetical protein